MDSLEKRWDDEHLGAWPSSCTHAGERRGTMSEPMVLAVVGITLVAAVIIGDLLDGAGRRRGESSSQDEDW
jgi:hypothetical protein